MGMKKSSRSMCGKVCDRTETLGTVANIKQGKRLFRLREIEEKPVCQEVKVLHLTNAFLLPLREIQIRLVLKLCLHVKCRISPLFIYV